VSNDLTHRHFGSEDPLMVSAASAMARQVVVDMAQMLFWLVCMYLEQHGFCWILFLEPWCRGGDDAEHDAADDNNC